MSETFYKSMPALCSDGRTRKVRVKCYTYDGSMAADTFFSVPANVYVRRKYIHGYVSGHDSEPPLAFHEHDACKGLI